MHAFLLLASDARVNSKIKELQAKPVEFKIEKIGDVREINNFTKLKLTEKTAIVIKDFDRAGEAAQNAFLKALEEPQENLTYILTAQNIDRVLPTIVSRCEVIDVYGMSYIVSSIERKMAEEFLNAEVGKKLKITAKITKREEAVQFIKNIIFVGHESVIKNSKTLSEALTTLKNLEANGNVQLQLTRFVASIA